MACLGPFFFFAMPTLDHDVRSEKPTMPRRGRPAGAVRLLTAEEVAVLLSVPRQTIYDWTYKLCGIDGKPILPTRKLGRRVRIPETALADLDERLAHRADAAGPFSFFSADGVSKQGGKKR